MKITFGIISCGDTCQYLPQILRSIHNLKGLRPCDREIIVVGGDLPPMDVAQVIPFNDKEKPGWITRKKNLITKVARFNNIVYSHDYVEYDRDWYLQWREFGEAWDVAVNRIECVGGNRFRDLILWDSPLNGHSWICREPWCAEGLEFAGSPCLPNYNYNTENKNNLVVSGTWFMAKRSFMQKYPLDERLMHCQAEDIEHSLRWRDDPSVKFAFNRNAICRLTKGKDPAFPIREDIV